MRPAHAWFNETILKSSYLLSFIIFVAAHSGSEHSVYQPASQQIPFAVTQQQVDYGATSTNGE